MKTVIRFLLAVVLVFQVQAATTIYKARLAFTGAPANNDTVVYNGQTITWKTTVTSSSSQVQIGVSATASAANLYAHLLAYPIDAIDPVYDGGVILYEIGTPNTVITASISGTYGGMTVTSTPASAYLLNLPLDVLAATNATVKANDVVGTFTFATSLVPAASVPFGNFVNLSTSQTIPGVKTFTGTFKSSHADSMYSAGNISNVIGRFIHFPYKAANSDKVGLWFYDSGAADAYAIASDASGHPQLLKITGGIFAGAADYSPSDADVLNRVIADYRYGQLAVANTWGANNTFTTFSGTHNSGGITNIPGGFTHIWALGDAGVNSTVIITNSLLAEQKIMGDTARLWLIGGGVVDARKWVLGTGAGSLELKLINDGGFIETTVLQFFPGGGGTSESVFNSAIRAHNSLISDADVFSYGSVQTLGPIVSGTTNSVFPTGLTAGLLLKSGATVTADPASGDSVIISYLGRPMYRASAEATGRMYDLHNATATTQAAGTDYPFSTSYAYIDSGTTDAKITVPTSSNYTFDAEVSITNGATDYDEYQIKLRNETAGVDLGGDQLIDHLPANKTGTVRVHCQGTASAGDVIAIWGKNVTAARGTAKSVRTRISYVRNY